MAIEDVVDLSNRFNNGYLTGDYSMIFEIVNRLVKTDVAQIARLLPGRDSENPDLCESMRMQVLIEDPKSYDSPEDFKHVLDLFNNSRKYTIDDLCTSVEHSNFDVFLYMVQKYFGCVVSIPDYFAEKLNKDYMRHKSELVLNKILCIYAYSKFKFDPKVKRKVSQFINKKKVGFKDI